MKHFDGRIHTVWKSRQKMIITNFYGKSTIFPSNQYFHKRFFEQYIAFCSTFPFNELLIFRWFHEKISTICILRDKLVSREIKSISCIMLSNNVLTFSFELWFSDLEKSPLRNHYHITYVLSRVDLLKSSSHINFIDVH